MGSERVREFVREQLAVLRGVENELLIADSRRRVDSSVPRSLPSQDVGTVERARLIQTLSRVQRLLEERDPAGSESASEALWVEGERVELSSIVSGRNLTPSGREFFARWDTESGEVEITLARSGSGSAS